MAENLPQHADYVAAIRWLSEQMGLEPDPEDGVWLATRMGRVLRLPPHLGEVLANVLNEEGRDGGG